MIQYFIYIITNEFKGTLYIGSTSNLIQRIYQHKSESIKGFTKLYHLHELVYYEECPDAKNMVTRERQIKKWNRAWKIRLIESINPKWNDLYPTLL
jgi:putative endonuclease